MCNTEPTHFPYKLGVTSSNNFLYITLAYAHTHARTYTYIYTYTHNPSKTTNTLASLQGLPVQTKMEVRVRGSLLLLLL